MLSRTILCLALASFSSAQETVSLFFPGADEMPLMASVIASDSTATTYAVQCTPGTDSTDCGIGAGIILTEGPSTVGFTMSVGGENDGTSAVLVTMSLGCSLAGTASAVCVESIGGVQADFPGVSTATFSGTDYEYQDVTLTTSSLSVEAAPASTGASTTPTNTSGSKSSATSSSQGSGASKTSSGESATSGTVQSTSTNTGGMAMITGNAQWIIGGAAVAAALM